MDKHPQFRQIILITLVTFVISSEFRFSKTPLTYVNTNWIELDQNVISLWKVPHSFLWIILSRALYQPSCHTELVVQREISQLPLYMWWTNIGIHSQHKLVLSSNDFVQNKSRVIFCVENIHIYVLWGLGQQRLHVDPRVIIFIINRLPLSRLLRNSIYISSPIDGNYVKSSSVDQHDRSYNIGDVVAPFY